MNSHLGLIGLNRGLSKILFEKKGGSGVSPDEVSDAIDKQYSVKITYDDDDYRRLGPRSIWVYDYGLTLAGNPAIRAFQWFGDTARGVPKWKLFRLDRIMSWEPDKPFRYFFTEPKMLQRALNIPEFNRNGDKSMLVVFKKVDLKATTNHTNRPEKEEEYLKPEETWISPLERERRRMAIARQNFDQSKTQNIMTGQNHGPVYDSNLTKELNADTPEWEQELDYRLGITRKDNPNINRGAVALGNGRYEIDNRTKQEMEFDRRMKDRDRTAFKSADERRKWRIGTNAGQESLYDRTKELEQRKQKNQIKDKEEDNNELEKF